jgi:membrane protein DedA with SNARE-associated domain
MSSVPSAQFIFLNAAGALVWAVTVGAGGYLFGEALEIMIGNVKRYEKIVLVVIAVIGLVIWGIHFLLKRPQIKGRG